jgi:hypothetical protein
MAQIVHLMGLEMWMGEEMRAGSDMKDDSLAHGGICETTAGEAEARNLRSQIATSSWGGRRNLPFALGLREFLANHKELAVRSQRIEDVQHRRTSVITILAEEISDWKRLPPPGPKRRIGFPRPG